MPRGDGTGPMGVGSMPGRMAGDCIGYTSHEFVNQGFGCGRGFGRGKGFRRISTGIPVGRRGYAHTSSVLYKQEMDEETGF